MPKTLDVYLYNDLTGHLIQDDGGQMTFSYSSTWLQNDRAIPLSHSLPLTKERFKRKDCRGFFAGILPEESNRELIAKNLGISPRNDFAMLEQIGGECAGAVIFMSAGKALEAQDHTYRMLSEAELAAIIKDLPKRPLLAGESGVRLSLAGAQGKIAVRVEGAALSIPLGNAPSSHILKPANPHFEGMVYNEAFCMKLARTIGLPVAAVEVRNAEGADYLLVKRYDRQAANEGDNKQWVRIHQEDFCQALNVVPEMKYQNEGGPSLKQCFDLVRDISSAPLVDLQQLLDAVIFNFLVYNHDAHGKNFSLLYARANKQIRLAPLYDIICTAYYPQLSKTMAMKIGGAYASADMYPIHFERLSEDIGFTKPLVRGRVLTMAEKMQDAIAQTATPHPVAQAVAKIISEHTQAVLERFK
jgi:serine/threonine-protein kinase HipA